MFTILVLNGPNMNLLGTREPDIYGVETLEDILTELRAIAQSMGVTLRDFQSNHEGALIDAVQGAKAEGVDGIILNAAGYTHTSVSLRDAIHGVDTPVIEVHMSNLYQREEFRHTSLLAPVCAGGIYGFGADSYLLALSAMYNLLGRLSEGEA